MSYISDKRLWLTKDRTEVVEDGDPQAAFLLVGKGGTLSDADAEKYGLTGLQEAPAPWDPVAEHEKLHAGETQAEADQRRAAMFKGNVTGETKAVTKAPENKMVATPAAQKLAEEKGVDLAALDVAEGKVTVNDVRAALSSAEGKDAEE